MKVAIFALLLMGTTFAARSPARSPARPPARLLTVEFIDVEGGQATLFVAPSGESLLIDTGWSGKNFRDADRIAAAAHRAGLRRIDYVLITHFHTDHVGGAPELVERIPVGTFIDHGPNRELTPGVNANYEAYTRMLAAGHYHHLVPKVGERLPIAGLEATVVSADGVVLRSPLPGAGEVNPYCAGSEVRSADTTENARSLGIEIQFGKLRILDLGDLTWDKEMELMCPVNRLGTAEILIVSHHGWNQSSSPALVAAVRPRVAIMDNGENKGGSVATFRTLAATPGLEQLWQLHWSAEAKDLNQADEFVANLRGADSGFGLRLTAGLDGRFAVENLRTGQVRTYR